MGPPVRLGAVLPGRAKSGDGARGRELQQRAGLEGTVPSASPRTAPPPARPSSFWKVPNARSLGAGSAVLQAGGACAGSPLPARRPQCRGRAHAPGAPSRWCGPPQCGPRVRRRARPSPAGPSWAPPAPTPLPFQVTGPGRGLRGGGAARCWSSGGPPVQMGHRLCLLL